MGPLLGARAQVVFARKAPAKISGSTAASIVYSRLVFDPFFTGRQSTD